MHCEKQGLALYNFENLPPYWKKPRTNGTIFIINNLTPKKSEQILEQSRTMSEQSLCLIKLIHDTSLIKLIAHITLNSLAISLEIIW